MYFRVRWEDIWSWGVLSLAGHLGDEAAVLFGEVVVF